MKILYPSSHWATNIGNPFFNLGAMDLLASSHSNIEIIQTDLFGAKCFDLKGRYLKNAFNYTEWFDSDIDAIVFSGPMFDKNFSDLFEPMFRVAQKRGVKIILLTTGGIEYTDDEVTHCRSVLRKYPPFILTTRDRDTYENYGDLAEHSYDGICTAWFVNDFYSGYSSGSLSPYVTSCFDITSEPSLNLRNIEIGSDNVVNSEVKHGTFQKVKRLFQTGLPSEVDGFRVIRPIHCCVKRVNRQLFFKPNSFVSQTPFGFLNLYRNTSLTVTDRLHAAVATMAFGNPARLYISSKRPKLLERVGASEVLKTVYRADNELIDLEKGKYKSWLGQVLSEFD